MCEATKPRLLWQGHPQLSPSSTLRAAQNKELLSFLGFFLAFVPNLKPEAHQSSS